VVNNGFSEVISNISNNPNAPVYSGQFNSFARAVHLTETNGKFGPIIGDHGAALGPLQIHEICYKDVVSSTGGKYSDCQSFEFSKKILYFYSFKYEKKALNLNNFEVLSKLWNGGPNWRKCKNPQNLKIYWLKIQKNLAIKKL
jgi:hypothetical protein